MWRLDTFLSGVRNCASGTICASLSWGGTSGGTAYGLQLEERKATGLDCFTMLHMSEVQQSSPACLAAFASGPMVFSFMSLPPSNFSIWSLDNVSACHTRLSSWACLATQTLPFFGHFACCWNPFTRLKVKKDVCILFPQVYQTISNILSSVGCAMQDAKRTEKSKEQLLN